MASKSFFSPEDTDVVYSVCDGKSRGVFLELCPLLDSARALAGLLRESAIRYELDDNDCSIKKVRLQKLTCLQTRRSQSRSMRQDWRS